MRIVVTGAAGFVGRALLRALAGHDVVSVDNRLDGVRGIEGDIGDPRTLSRVFAQPCDAVVHLATVPGGAAEANSALAKRVNLDAAMGVIEAAAEAGNRPRFVFASSIAVFGDPLPPRVDDATPIAPRLLYGAHKAMIEQWIATQTRRGAISGLSLRLSGIVARPKAPSGMKSAFMSDLFHAMAANQPIVLPVSPEATMWLMSVERVAANLAHALKIDATGEITLPAVRTSMAGLVAEVSSATGVAASLVRYSPDPAIEAGFGRQPPLSTHLAQARGFRADADLRTLVASALSTLS